MNVTTAAAAKQQTSRPTRPKRLDRQSPLNSSTGRATAATSSGQRTARPKVQPVARPSDSSGQSATAATTATPSGWANSWYVLGPTVLPSASGTTTVTPSRAAAQAASATSVSSWATSRAVRATASSGLQNRRQRQASRPTDTTATTPSSVERMTISVSLRSKAWTELISPVRVVQVATIVSQKVAQARASVQRGSRPRRR